MSRSCLSRVRRPIGAIAIAGAASLAAAAGGPAAAQEPDHRDRLEAVGVEEQALLGELAAIEQAIAAVDLEIASISAREQEVAAALADSELRAAAALRAEARAEGDLDRQRLLLQAHAVDVYVTGDQGDTGRAQVLAVLDTTEPLDVSVISAYGGSVIEDQDRVVSDFERAEASATRARRRAWDVFEPGFEDLAQHRLADGPEAQGGERDSQLAPGEHEVQLAQDLEGGDAPAVAGGRQLLHAGPPHRDQSELRSDEECVRAYQHEDRGQLPGGQLAL